MIKRLLSTVNCIIIYWYNISGCTIRQKKINLSDRLFQSSNRCHFLNIDIESVTDKLKKQTILLIYAWQLLLAKMNHSWISELLIPIRWLIGHNYRLIDSHFSDQLPTLYNIHSQIAATYSIYVCHYLICSYVKVVVL